MDLFTEENLREFLYLLNVSKRAEEDTIIKECREFGDNDPSFINANGKHASLWEHFVYFLTEVRRLVGRVRRIENMIRDVEDAANAHGENESIFLSHFHLVFEDIQNDAVAVVIFRSIEPKEESIKYGRVKHYLIALKQMRRNCDRALLEKSRYDQVDRAGFLDIVMKRARARDDDSDDSDAEDDDDLRADTQAQQEQIQAIRTEANNIYDRIRQMNSLKISLSQCFLFLRSLGKDLNDNDVTKYIRQRFSDYNRKLGTNVSVEERTKSDSWRYSKECTLKEFQEIITISEMEMTRIKAGKKVGKKMIFKGKKRGKKRGGATDNSSTNLMRVGTDYTGRSRVNDSDADKRLTGAISDDDDDDNNTIHKLKRRDSDEALIMPSKKKDSNRKKKKLFGRGGTIFYSIDDEDDIPKMDDVKTIYGKLSLIYSVIGLADRPNMSTGDVENLLHVLMNIQDRLRNEIRLRSFDMELTQELFCKSLEKSMEKSLKSDYNYKKPFHQWTQVAREAASVFQQVRDLEQGHVTLGQVRETLVWIRNDITSLCSLTRLKNKLKRLKGSDQMVDHDLWWSFLVNHLGVVDDRAIYIEKMRKKGMIIGDINNNNNNNITSTMRSDTDNAIITKTGTIDAETDSGHGMSIASGIKTSNNQQHIQQEQLKSDGQSPSTDDEVIGRQASQSIDMAINVGSKGNSPGSAEDIEHREARARSLLVRQPKGNDDVVDGESEKLTFYERAARIFDLMEDQNGSWITMRQIHCYVLWLTSKLSDPRIDWKKYVPQNAQEERQSREISEKEFKKIILEALYLESHDKNKRKKSSGGSGDGDVTVNIGPDFGKKSAAMPVIKVHKIEDVILAAGTSEEAILDVPLITTQISTHGHSKDDVRYYVETANVSGDEKKDDNFLGIDSASSLNNSGMQPVGGQASLTSLQNEKKMIELQTKESEKELNRILRNVDYDDIAMFSRELSWIFRQCVAIESSKLEAGDETDKAHWRTIYEFVEPFRNNRVSKRVGHDIAFLSGIHDVFRDEFEQFKATLQCRGETALSLFYQIRHFAESVSWNQINYFVEFLETMLINVEFGIDKEERGEDEDPNEDELQELMEISSDAMASWLFSVVIRRHSDKISWIELREYLVDWHEQRDEVAEFFEELVEHRQAAKYQQMLFDEINNKVSKIKTYFDDNVALSKDELNKRSKDELIQMITKSEWWYSARSGNANIMGNSSAYINANSSSSGFINNNINNNQSGSNQSLQPIRHKESSNRSPRLSAGINYN